MGKVTSAVSSMVAIGIFAFFIYYCCLRRKKQRSNNGTVIHVTTGGGRVPPAIPNPMPYNPTNPGPIVPPGQYGYPYPATNYGQPMPQPGIYPGGQTFVGNPHPAQNASYPNYISGSGHPMPMPMPLDSASLVQSSYPSAPPAPQCNDLPPPYSEVTKR